ncbi:MAG: ornithine carbamoyltransferase, partial [Chloroflexi bacterium]|nr:ornithine carbamoyltransferase [Chloroflexota bacterium]
MTNKNLLSIADLTPKVIESLVERAIDLKAGSTSKALAGRSVVLLFEKPSLRTRASFDVGIHQLGGYCLYMGGQEVGLGVR